MHVYIGNATERRVIFNYCKAKGHPTRRVEIPPACQAPLLDEFDDAASTAWIEKQMQLAGYRPASDVAGAGIVYAFSEKPITVGKLNTAYVEHKKVVQELAGDKAEQAGLGAFEGIRKTNPDWNLHKVSTSLDEVSGESADGRPKKDGIAFQADVDLKADKPMRTKKR
jgi:hypothetical protein